MQGRWDYGLQQSGISGRLTQLARPMLFSKKFFDSPERNFVRFNVLFCMMQRVRFSKLDKQPGCFGLLQGNYQE